ncbi:hypothetical protein EZS27_007434 [termite gut metagenome]|uniref:alpha-L-fucosidase n=1 Tax=termite gut metagenome TaxID=433724 RepID=A0A5J4SI90_9ZZZZ
MKKNTWLILSFLFNVWILSAQETNPVSYSKLVYPDANGKLVYKPYTAKGDILPDFSWCGYKGGGVAIPEVSVVAVVDAVDESTDDSPRIQAVIDSVARLTPDANGFRGTIRFKKGLYRIASPLRITSGGIVLRGDGDDKDNGTILLATTPNQYNVIELGIKSKIKPDERSKREITDVYVPSGSRVIHIKGASSIYKKGDAIVVQRPSVAEWIHAIGMDSIAPRPLKGETTYDSFLRYRKTGEKTNLNGTVQWKPGSKDLYFERTIVDIKGDEIILDIPLTNALQKEYGGAIVYRYEIPGRIAQCGVEDVYGMSVYDPAIQKKDNYIGMYACDENHANNFVYFNAVENAWVRNVTVEQFDCCVWTTHFSRFITGEDLAAISPVSEITGGRRYAYSVGGQQCLFQRCYSSHHRHEFVLAASVAGPNAFVDGYGEMTFASSEPHQRWAAGCLYDNITIKGPGGSLLSVNRGWFGSGHGWAGAQIIFWNCSAPVIMVMQPPTAQNFAIGTHGEIKDEWVENSRNSTIYSINNVSRSHFEYQNYQSVGDGWIESPGNAVNPQSLYYKQLEDRLGTDAVKQVSSRHFEAQTRDQKMKWWREARLGLFIHWGPYALLGGEYNGHQQLKSGAEWIMNRCKIPVAEYQTIAKQFNPVKYDPDAWVKLAKEAGMKYIIITAKHHDGFAMFKSKASPFNIVDFTPYQKDVLDELAKACRRHHIKLGFYYSQAQDWNNPGGSVARKVMSEGWLNPDSARIDAYTAEHNGRWDPTQETRTMEQYIDEVSLPQVRELLTNYGDIAVIWWDTPTQMTDAFAAKLQAELDKYPQIITNDRLKRPNFPGDYKTPEQKIPNPDEIKGFDWETCMTMDDSWGYRKQNQYKEQQPWKSEETLIQNIAKIASMGGNYLLNVGPDPEGEIPPQSIERLRGIGKWMKANGEAIYGTSASPFEKPDWGYYTLKNSGNQVLLYLFIYNYPADGKLPVKDIKIPVKSASLLGEKITLTTETTPDGLIVNLPEKSPETILPVVKLELTKKLLSKSAIGNGKDITFKILDE